MVVRIEHEDKHVNFYEGAHVGFHKRDDAGLCVIVEGSKNCVTIEIEPDSHTRIFLMNDNGKTIDSEYL